MTTADRARSPDGGSQDARDDAPWPSVGMCSPPSPALVTHSRSRSLLRCVSCPSPGPMRPASMTSAASASIRAQRTSSTPSPITAMCPPALLASGRSVQSERERTTLIAKARRRLTAWSTVRGPDSRSRPADCLGSRRPGSSRGLTSASTNVPPDTAWICTPPGGAPTAQTPSPARCRSDRMAICSLGRLGRRRPPRPRAAFALLSRRISASRSSPGRPLPVRPVTGTRRPPATNRATASAWPSVRPRTSGSQRTRSHPGRSNAAGSQDQGDVFRLEGPAAPSLGRMWQLGGASSGERAVPFGVVPGVVPGGLPGAVVQQSAAGPQVSPSRHPSTPAPSPWSAPRL